MGAVFRKHPKQEQPVPRPQVQTEHPAQGFDPRHLSTPLLVWCRADAGVESNGSTVSKWRDMGGRGRDFSQATASEQPALSERGLGKRQELTFDGSDDVLDGPSLYGVLSDDAEWTTVVVCRGWTWGGSSSHNSGRSVLGAPSGGGGYFNQSILTEAAGGPAGGFYNGSAHKTAVAASAGDEGDPLIWSMVNDGGDLTVRVNGSAGSTVSGAGRLQSASTTLGLGHGTGSGSSTAFWDGAISEVLIFDGTLNAQDIGMTEDYLADRYSIRVSG